MWTKGREPDERGINIHIIIYTSPDNSILLVQIIDSVQGQLFLRQTPTYMPTLSKQTFVTSSPHCYHTLKTYLLIALSLESIGLLRLTSVSPSALYLLVSAHAGTQGDIDTRRGWETETFGDFDEIEFIDVEDGAEGVWRIGVDVGSVTFFGGFVEVVVLGDDCQNISI